MKSTASGEDDKEELAEDEADLVADGDPAEADGCGSF